MELKKLLQKFRTTSAMKYKLIVIEEENKSLHWKKRKKHSELELIFQSTISNGDNWRKFRYQLKKYKEKGYNISLYETKYQEHLKGDDKSFKPKNS